MASQSERRDEGGGRRSIAQAAISGGVTFKLDLSERGGINFSDRDACKSR